MRIVHELPHRRRRLAAALVLLVLLPTIVIGALATVQARDAVHDRVRDGQVALVDTLAAQVAREHDRVAQGTLALASRRNVAEAVRSSDADALEDVFAHQPVEGLPYTRLTAYDLDGRMVATWPDESGPRFTPPRQGGSLDLLQRGPDQYMRAVHRVSHPGTGAYVGWLAAEVPMSGLLDRIQDVSFGSSGYATLVDDDGHVLATGDPMRMDTSIQAPELLDAISQESTNWVGFYSPLKRSRELAAVAPIATTGWSVAVTQSESEALAPVQQYTRMLVLLMMLTAAGGGVGAWVLSDRIYRNAQRLQESEELRRRIIESAQHAFVSADINGTIREWNAAATRMFGWRREEVVGRTAAEVLVPEAAREQYASTLRKLQEHGRSRALERPFEMDLLHRDGHTVPAELRISAVRAGGAQTFHAFIADITEQRRTQQQMQESTRVLEQLNDELRLADEVKSQFLAMASHELRTPLTAISGFASTMLGMWATLSDEHKREFLEIIDAQSRRLSRLVEDLLTLSRIESGRLQTDPQHVDVQEVVSQTIRELGGEDVEVACPEGLQVFAERDHLQQILLNYISNALKYGGAPVSVVAMTDGEWVDIEVCDCGDGVAADFVPRLFERFTQDKRATGEAASGTGLGLSIVAGLAEANGGATSFRPNTPQGSRFCVRLPQGTPLAPGSDDDDATVTAAGPDDETA